MLKLFSVGVKIPMNNLWSRRLDGAHQQLFGGFLARWKRLHLEGVVGVPGGRTQTLKMTKINRSSGFFFFNLITKLYSSDMVNFDLSL